MIDMTNFTDAIPTKQDLLAFAPDDPKWELFIEQAVAYAEQSDKMLPGVMAMVQAIVVMVLVENFAQERFTPDPFVPADAATNTVDQVVKVVRDEIDHLAKTSPELLSDEDQAVLKELLGPKSLGELKFVILNIMIQLLDLNQG